MTWPFGDFNTITSLDAEETAIIQNVTWSKLWDKLVKGTKPIKTIYDLNMRGFQCTKFGMWEYQTILPVSWETCMKVKKQQLDLDMEQQTSSK